MPAFRITGGECHWRIEFCFYVVLGRAYAVNEGCYRQGVGGELEPIPEEFYEISRDQIRRLHRTFHRFFNKDLKFRQDYSVRRGEYTRYAFRPCCTFEIDIGLRPITPEMVRQTGSIAGLKAVLPQGCGAIVLERMSIADNAHAEIGGRIIVMNPGQSLRYTFPHELGHILGLPDRYSHPAEPQLDVPEVDLPAEVEDAYAGRLMGRVKNNKREITADDSQEISDAVSGLSCDAEVCCPAEGVEPNQEKPDDHPPGTTRPRLMRPWEWHYGVGTVDVLPSAAEERQRQKPSKRRPKH